ncbi:hypothetical protein BKA57DRAFT_520331, partial [Linnemannia elongata]
STYFVNTRCAFGSDRNSQTRRKNRNPFFVQESQKPFHLPLSQPIGHTSSPHSTYTMVPIKNNKNVQPKPTRRAKGHRVSLDPQVYQPGVSNFDIVQFKSKRISMAYLKYISLKQMYFDGGFGLTTHLVIGHEMSRGLGSSSPTLSPPHRPLFDVKSDDNERKQDEVADGGEASGDKKADVDGRPSSNLFNGPVDASETGDLSWIQWLPAFTFSLPLTKDWGPQVTETYNKIKKMTSLDYKQVGEIAQVLFLLQDNMIYIQTKLYKTVGMIPCQTGLLSGILYFDEKHAVFEPSEMSVITNEIFHRFYTRDLQEKDLTRSVEAAALWGAGPVIDLTMDSCCACQQNDILPVLFVALYVFRHFIMLSKLKSESDALSSSIVQILREFMEVPGLIQIWPDYQHALEAKRREPMKDNKPFPTLATPLRNVALGIQSKAKVVKRKGKQTMEVKEGKRNKETVEA